MRKTYSPRSSPKTLICVTRIRLGEAAKQDLREIRAFSKDRFGATVARAYLTGMRHAFRRLAERPGLGVSEDDLAGGLRSLGYRSHRRYYRVEPGEIIIVRILHHAQHSPAALWPNP